MVSASGCNWSRFCSRQNRSDEHFVGACRAADVTVEVRSDNGKRVAYAQDLPQTADRPIARLTLQDNTITREDLWPTKQEIGEFVILPGGEVGQLLNWWNAEAGSEWRWQVEFYNHR